MNEISEERIREIVRDELEKGFIKDLKDSVNSLNLTVKELRLIVDDLKEREKKSEERLDKLEKAVEELVQWSKENTKAIQELRKVTEENTLAIQELKKRTEENTRAIEELRKVSEENTKAIQELKKRTEENTLAIQELRKRNEENSKAIEELTKRIDALTQTVDRLSKIVEMLTRELREVRRDLGGISNTIGIMFEDTIRESIVKWFKENNIQVSNVAPKTIRIGKKLLEFDMYTEVENKIYVGEVKITLREKDVETFSNKIAILRSSVSKEVVPLLIYRYKSGNPLKLAKGYGINVFKYVKGGELIEMR